MLRHVPFVPTFLQKAKPIMSVPNEIAGLAALSICESLLLALNDRKILPEHEIVGILQDAAAAHEFAVDAKNEADAEMTCCGLRAL